MICALAKDIVLAEILELARQKIAGVLKVESDVVIVEIGQSNGKLSPRISVPPEACEGLTEEQVQMVMRAAYMGTMVELRERLSHVGDIRGQEEDKEEEEEPT